MQDSKIAMGPVWDFEWSLGIDGTKGQDRDQPIIMCGTQCLLL